MERTTTPTMIPLRNVLGALAFSVLLLALFFGTWKGGTSADDLPQRPAPVATVVPSALPAD